MAPPTTRGGGFLSPKKALAFAVGLVIGAALVTPVLPKTVVEELATMVGGGGGVILVGVGALGVLMVFLAVFYQFYL